MQDRKWSITTIVVMVYLIVNIVGRLSVAAFGLTFDLNEQPGIDYPIKITNWNTDEWLNQSATTDMDYDFFNQNMREFKTRYLFYSEKLLISLMAALMNKYATVGLSTVPSEFDSKNPLTYNATNITGHGFDRVVHGDTVTYSYRLKEYRGLQISSSRTEILHSSSSCIGRAIWGSNVYVDGQMVGNFSKHDPPLNLIPRWLTKARSIRLNGRPKSRVHQHLDGRLSYLSHCSR